MSVEYCRKQLAFILQAVKSGSRSTALDCIQRLSDGLDHVEAALKGPGPLACVVEAVKQSRIGSVLSDHRDTWSPDAHIEITLTAAEVWAIQDYLEESK